MTTSAPEAPSTPSPEKGGRNFWASPWTIASVALVVVLIGALVWLVLDDPEPRAPTSSPDATSEPAPEAAGDACGPTGGSQIPPAVAPDTDWVLVGAMAAPTSEDIGPAETADGVGVCFAPTPAGALFAAGTFAATLSSGDLRLSAVLNLTVDDDGRQAAIDGILAEADFTDSVGVQIAGYAFSSYKEAESAVIDLVVTSQGRLLHVPFELTWSGTDWDVVLPATGRPLDQLAVLDSMGGYTPWQGA